MHEVPFIMLSRGSPAGTISTKLKSGNLIVRILVLTIFTCFPVILNSRNRLSKSCTGINFYSYERKSCANSIKYIKKEIEETLQVYCTVLTRK